MNPTYEITLTPMTASGLRILAACQPGKGPYLAAPAELSKIEWDTAVCAAQGATVAEIAVHLGLSPNTVKTHIKRIYMKLGVSSRLELQRLIDSFRKGFP